MQQLNLFQTRQCSCFEDFGVESFTDDELRNMLQSAIGQANSAIASEYFQCSDHLDDLLIASQFSRDAHIIALRDVAKASVGKLNEQIEEFKAEIGRSNAWSNVRPMSAVFSEFMNPFPAKAARFVRGSSY